ncbi:MAG: hypothetical protein D6806_08470 [Deltaproteobacteria bacterium]|nr:MAG: hypothetical protein D6806_08470 [Deltaproteobacteria bacterium]
MKSKPEYLAFNVPERMDFVHTTDKVQHMVLQSGITEAPCLVNAMHITASVLINDDEPVLDENYKEWIERLARF